MGEHYTPPCVMSSILTCEIASYPLSRQVAARLLVVLPNVHQGEFLARLEALLHFAKAPLLDARFRVVDDRQKSRLMFH
jgi:hypothetical protein